MDVGNLYDILFDERNDADYGDFAIYTLNEVEPLLTKTKRVVETLIKWIEENK